MKINFQDSLARFGQYGKGFAQGSLQRVLKDGPAALFDHRKQHPSRSNSDLTSLQRVETEIDSQSTVQAKVALQSERSQRQEGSTLRVSTHVNIRSTTQAQNRQDVRQRSEQLVQGQVNGKAVFSHTSRDLQQTSVASAATQAQENRTQLDATTRQVEKKGATTRVLTHVDTAQQRDRSQESEAARRIETQIVAKTYDRAGQVVSEKTTRQAVSTTQATAVDQSVTASGSRDIEQTTSVSAGREGKADVRQTRVDTEDSSAGHQAIDTQTTARTTTLVENLDADGKVISARAQAQEVHTSQSRSIDGTRAQSTEQVSKSKVAANVTETQNRTSVEVHASTVDRTQTRTEVDNFNGEGLLVSERTINRDVTVSTIEDRSAESQARTSVTKEIGATTTAQEISNREQASVATRTSSVQDGVKSERLVTAEADVRTQSELENRVEANGSRTVEIATEQVRRSEVDDLSVNAKGQGRLVETETVSRQKVEGQLEFDPATNRVAAPGTTPGFASIQFGTMTGLRSSFRMDEGVLEFDFEAEALTSTSQQTSTGQVVVSRKGDTDVAGPSSERERASVENVRFRGQIVASRDAAGNRVLDVEATVVSRTAAVAADGGKVVQAERTQSEMHLEARLSLDRQTSGDGTTRTQATGDLQLERVERHEAAGTTPTLQRLSTQDAFRAGFSLSDGALRFNFGGFNLGVGLFA